MFKKINEAIFELLKFKKNIVKCDMCKCLIMKEDAVDGEDQIRVRVIHGLYNTKYEKYIAEIKFCPICAMVKQEEANKLNKKNAKRK